MRIGNKQSIDEFEVLFSNKVNHYKMAGGEITDGQIMNRFIQAIGERS